MPPHHALRKYQGPGVWAHVKADYLAGEPGRVVAQRYDVSLSNLRRRAGDEGWTRAAHARAADRPPPPCAEAVAPAPPPASAPPAPAELSLEEALQAALVQARRQLAEGQGAQAAATLKAAEALRRLQAEMGAVDDPDPDPGPWADGEAPSFASLPPEFKVVGLEGLRAETEAAADRLARALLTADAAMTTPALHTPFVLHWRARHLGPEAAALDREAAVRCGWASRAYDADGRLLPLADLLAAARRGFAPDLPDTARLPPIDAVPAWLAPVAPFA
ncbi:MAG: hypothetical protein INR64_14065 [Caulobacteraceae bacterium]|nr:hypothetical protein [Caulobacter sp.]